MILDGKDVLALFKGPSGKNSQRPKISRAKGGWFESLRMCPQQVVILYCFVHHFSYNGPMREVSIFDEILSFETLIDRYSYAKKVYVIVLNQLYEQEGQKGSIGKIIEVDGTKICQAKVWVRMSGLSVWLKEILTIIVIADIMIPKRYLIL